MEHFNSFILPPGSRPQYIWTRRTPLFLKRAKDMVFEQGIGVRGVACISYVLLLSMPRETR